MAYPLFATFASKDGASPIFAFVRPLESAVGLVLLFLDLLFLELLLLDELP